jgi:lipopolysaccharide biosynthesis regulator YciM
MNAAWNLAPELSSPLTLIIAGGLLALVILLLARLRASRSAGRNSRAAALASQPFERGFDLLLDARWQEAAAVLKQAVRIDPARRLEYLELGKLFRRQGEANRAARMFEQLLARADLDRATRLTAQYELALAYQGLGWHEAAAEVLEHVLGVDPAHAEARRKLRSIHEEMGRWGTAAALELLRLQRGEATDGRTLAALLTQQGKASWAAGDWREGSAHLRSALALDPECIEAALYLGRIFLQQGKVRQAFHIWDGLAKDRPEFLFLAFRDIQAAFRQLQNDVGWEGFLRAFTERHPDDPTGYLALAEWYESCGRIEEAMHCLRRVLERDPVSREAHMALLSLYRAQGAPSDVLDTYAQLAQGSPRASGGYFRCLACGDTRDEPFGKCPCCHAWATAERRLSHPSGMPILLGEITPQLSRSGPEDPSPIAVRRESPVHPVSDV